MKKVLALALALLLTAALCACGGEGDDTAATTTTTTGSTTAATTTTAAAADDFVAPQNYASVITITINPQFRLYLDATGAVLAVEPVNADAKSVAEKVTVCPFTSTVCERVPVFHLLRLPTRQYHEHRSVV
jgi:hypothetical protein